MNVRLPRLLDRDLQERTRLHPASLSLTENLSPLSTASMRLPPEEPRMTPGDWVELYARNGSAGIFRVSEAERDAAGMQRVWLEHGLASLSDYTVFGKQSFAGLDTGGDTGAVLLNGVVQVTQAKVRASASGSAEVLGQVRQNEAVAVTGAKGAWYCIARDTLKGWLPKRCLLVTGDAVPTLAGVATALLNTQQPAKNIRWTIGSFEAEEHTGCCFENMNTLQALLSLPEYAEEDLMWDFDQQVTPWQVRLKRVPTQVGCELRLRRNVCSLRISGDREELCTRIYPLGKNGLTIEDVNDGCAWLQSGTAETYGVVERIYRAPEEDNAAALLCGARKQLRRLCRPSVMVEVDAQDLYAETGEPLDLLRPGMLCRLALPGSGDTMEARVVRLHRPDVLHLPSQVTVTLSATLTTADTMLSGLRSGRWTVE